MLYFVKLQQVSEIFVFFAAGLDVFLHCSCCRTMSVVNLKMIVVFNMIQSHRNNGAFSFLLRSFIHKPTRGMSALHRLTASLRDAINKTRDVWKTLLCLVCRMFWWWICLSGLKCFQSIIWYHSVCFKPQPQWYKKVPGTITNFWQKKTQTSEWSRAEP